MTAWAATAETLRVATWHVELMRDGPGLAYPVMRRLALGQEVEVRDRASGWMRLRLPADGTVGWVSGSLVSDAKLN